MKRDEFWDTIIQASAFGAFISLGLLIYLLAKEFLF